MILSIQADLILNNDLFTVFMQLFCFIFFPLHRFILLFLMSFCLANKNRIEMTLNLYSQFFFLNFLRTSDTVTVPQRPRKNEKDIKYVNAKDDYGFRNPKHSKIIQHKNMHWIQNGTSNLWIIKPTEALFFSL